jgi:hypothetical protein
MFRLTPFAPMLVQWAKIGRVQSFFLEEAEYRENKEREGKDETREVKNEDD